MAAVVLLVGCREVDNTPVVRFSVWGDPLEQAAFRAVADRFEKLNPHVRVEINGLPDKTDFSASLATEFAAGTPPDVFVLNYRRLAQFYNQDSLQPLGPFLAQSDVLDESDFYGIALDAFRDSQGTLVCIPHNISSQVIYYNRDLFDKAGVPYPTASWDWEQFRQAAIALTSSDHNGDGEPDQFGLGMEPTILRMAPFIWQNGGELVDDWENPTTLTLDSAESQQALSFVIDLSVIDGVFPNASQEAVQSQGNRFLNGNIAMYINSRRITPTLRESAEFNWDVAPLPHGERAATILHSDGYCMSRNSEVSAVAWQFIEFAVSEEGQQIASQLGRAVPSLKSVATSPYFLEPTQPPANAQVWLDVVPDLRLLPRLEHWSQIERKAAVTFELAFLGRQPLIISINEIQATSAERFMPLR